MLGFQHSRVVGFVKFLAVAGLGVSGFKVSRRFGL